MDSREVVHVFYNEMLDTDNTDFTEKAKEKICAIRGIRVQKF